MNENEIQPENIPNEDHVGDPANPKEINRSKRYFLTRAKGRFPRHSGCERSWSSGHSWSVLDLKMQQFHHRYGQDCKACNESVKPVYKEDAVEKMARWACQTYKSRIGAKQAHHSGVPAGDIVHTRGPHEQSLCEMCKMLRRECWK